MLQVKTTDAEYNWSTVTIYFSGHVFDLMQDPSYPYFEKYLNADANNQLLRQIADFLIKGLDPGDEIFVERIAKIDSKPNTYHLLAYTRYKREVPTQATINSSLPQSHFNVKTIENFSDENISFRYLNQLDDRLRQQKIKEMAQRVSSYKGTMKASGLTGLYPHPPTVLTMLPLRLIDEENAEANFPELIRRFELIESQLEQIKSVNNVYARFEQVEATLHAELHRLNSHIKSLTYNATQHTHSRESQPASSIPYRFPAGFVNKLSISDPRQSLQDSPQRRNTDFADVAAMQAKWKSIYDLLPDDVSVNKTHFLSFHKRPIEILVTRMRRGDYGNCREWQRYINQSILVALYLAAFECQRQIWQETSGFPLQDKRKEELKELERQFETILTISPYGYLQPIEVDTNISLESFKTVVIDPILKRCATRNKAFYLKLIDDLLSMSIEIKPGTSAFVFDPVNSQELIFSREVLGLVDAGKFFAAQEIIFGELKALLEVINDLNKAEFTTWKSLISPSLKADLIGCLAFFHARNPELKLLPQSLELLMTLTPDHWEAEAPRPPIPMVVSSLNIISLENLLENYVTIEERFNLEPTVLGKLVAADRVQEDQVEDAIICLKNEFQNQEFLINKLKATVENLPANTWQAVLQNDLEQNIAKWETTRQRVLDQLEINKQASFELLQRFQRVLLSHLSFGGYGNCLEWNRYINATILAALYKAAYEYQRLIWEDTKGDSKKRKNRKYQMAVLQKKFDLILSVKDGRLLPKKININLPITQFKQEIVEETLFQCDTGTKSRALTCVLNQLKALQLPINSTPKLAIFARCEKSYPLTSKLVQFGYLDFSPTTLELVNREDFELAKRDLHFNLSNQQSILEEREQNKIDALRCLISLNERSQLARLTENFNYLEKKIHLLNSWQLCQGLQLATLQTLVADQMGKLKHDLSFATEISSKTAHPVTQPIITTFAVSLRSHLEMVSNKIEVEDLYGVSFGAKYASLLISFEALCRQLIESSGELDISESMVSFAANYIYHLTESFKSLYQILIVNARFLHLMQEIRHLITLAKKLQILGQEKYAEIFMVSISLIKTAQDQELKQRASLQEVVEELKRQSTLSFSGLVDEEAVLRELPLTLTLRTHWLNFANSKMIVLPELSILSEINAQLPTCIEEITQLMANTKKILDEKRRIYLEQIFLSIAVNILLSFEHWKEFSTEPTYKIVFDEQAHEIPAELFYLWDSLTFTNGNSHAHEVVTAFKRKLIEVSASHSELAEEIQRVFLNFLLWNVEKLSFDEMINWLEGLYKEKIVDPTQFHIVTQALMASIKFEPLEQPGRVQSEKKLLGKLSRSPLAVFFPSIKSRKESGVITPDLANTPPAPEVAPTQPVSSSSNSSITNSYAEQPHSFLGSKKSKHKARVAEIKPPSISNS